MIIDAEGDARQMECAPPWTDAAHLKEGAVCDNEAYGKILMAPNEHIQEYIQIVEKEIEGYKQFRTLLMEEQNLLVSGQVLSLHENIRSQSLLLGEIRKIEEFRDTKKELLAEAFSIQERPVSLRMIANALADESKTRLLSLLEDFKFVVKDIVKINKNNQKLIEHGKGFIQELIEGIYRALNKEEFYNPQQKSTKKNLKVVRLFDRKI